MSQKIFCIGLSRTGTTSLSKALSILGYKSIHLPGFLYFPHYFIQLKPKYLNNYDAFSDISVIPFYKKLDARFKHAKFIYTIRDKEKWLESCSRYPRFQMPIHKVPLKLIALRYEIYNSIQFDYRKFSRAYDDHHNDVMEYFSKREEELLIMSPRDNNKWNKLSEFLNVPIPNCQYPRINTKDAPRI